MTPQSKDRNGAALIIALAIMVLVLALVVGMLTRVTTDRTAAGGYAAMVEARLLADTAVQVVQAQINAATSEGAGIAWTSQPGLLRTFDSSGNPSKSYKLYSDGAMQVAGGINGTIEAAKLANWFSNPAMYTDLNMPADTDYDGILDRWPILDPSADGIIEGFSLAGAPTGNFLGLNNPAPMPVRWLYVLKDGQVFEPTGNGTARVDAATPDNPIVGRIAFWTDDETCKVNVNTASEGSYWDIPRGWSPSERSLAEYQPTNREFQSYPGHPATTSLSPVFPELSRDQIFSLVPRLQNGGSQNMTVSVASAGNVTLDTDRLYATQDELLFTSNRTTQLGSTGNQSVLERRSFFLTTTSRAPETNLFNLPRIVSWPLHDTDSTAYRSAFDRLIAFCGTLNSYEYFFQRRNPFSMTEDYDSIERNRQLLAYLRALTSRPIPGFGGNLGSKFGSDRDQILTEVFDYIRSTNTEDANLARANQYAPGTDVGGSSAGGGDYGRGQVLPIRIAAWNTRGFGRVPVITEVGLWLICAGTAASAESNDPATNFALPAGTPLTADATTQQIRIEAAAVLEPFIPLEGYKNLQPDVEILIDGLQSWTIQGNAAGEIPQSLEFPSETRQTASDAGRYVTGELRTFTGVYPRGGHVGVWSFLGDRGLRARNSGRLAQDPLFSNLTQQYPFVGEPVTVRVTKASPLVTLSSVPLQITIRNRRTSEVIQRYELNFPGGTFPAPELQTNPSKAWTFQERGGGVTGGRLNSSISIPPYYFQGNTPVGSTALSDITRTIVPGYTASGATQSADFRLLAMANDVEAADFVKHPRFDTTSSLWRVANSFVQQTEGHSYHMGRNSGQYNLRITDLGGAAISLAKGVGSYGHLSHPDTVLPATDAQKTGDWDNGVGTDIDGPYLNKPDEGVAYSTVGATNIPYFHSFQTAFDAEKFYAPNRIMPSPGMFGSLPTGVKRGLHWQTLLFRRQPGHPSSPGADGTFSNDPDYLFLDLFWMPVVEPYAISEPLSTAGKVNMNQELMPFSWIARNTALLGVLKNEKVIAMANSQAALYKKNLNLSAPFSTDDFRQSINVDATLTQFTQRFNNADGTGLFAFRAPAEICDIHIVPGNATVDTSSKASLDAGMRTYWEQHALTGDNSRERIYTTVYPRLTTKSNTFTVHFRVQTLKPRPGGDPKVWSEGAGAITCDFRGATTLERYIDPHDTRIPDYATDPDATPTLESLYRWRLRSHRPFTP